ncbi:uncharacterized protein [Arachis hypogaea]|uniref:uncharacterized protein n=1 Tax=Arachis hypogaea TaxID=3818 RepID=UPI003B21DC0E
MDAINGLDDHIIIDELNFDKLVLKHELEINLACMNMKQKGTFNKVITVVDQDAGGLFFVFKYGETAKMYFHKIMSIVIRSKNKIFLNTTSSGIASLLLPNGRTTYSRFKILLELNEDSVCCKQGTSLAKLVCRAKFIIWDEISTLNKLCYEALDKSLRDIFCFEPNYNAYLPFGKKMVVLGGDFAEVAIMEISKQLNLLNRKIGDWLTKDSTEGDL